MKILKTIVFLFSTFVICNSCKKDLDFNFPSKVQSVKNIELIKKIPLETTGVNDICAIGDNFFIAGTHFFKLDPKGMETEIISRGNNFGSISFPTSLIGYASGAKKGLFKTTNAGNSWESLNIPTNNTITNCSFFNENVGFIADIQANLYKTEDGGNSFQKVEIELTEITHIKMESEQTIIVCGGQLSLENPPTTYKYSGKILKSKDLGKSWEAILSDLELINHFQFLNDDIGFAVSHRQKVFSTQNGGKSWVHSNSVGNKFTTQCVHFINQNVGLIGGYYFSSSFCLENPNSLVKSLNSGVAWDIEFNECSGIQGFNPIASNDLFTLTAAGGYLYLFAHKFEYD